MVDFNVFAKLHQNWIIRWYNAEEFDFNLRKSQFDYLGAIVSVNVIYHWIENISLDYIA